jgi:hypothetical protein
MGYVDYLDRAADQFAIFSNVESSYCKHKPLLVINNNASVSRGLQIVRCVLRTRHLIMTIKKGISQNAICRTHSIKINLVQFLLAEINHPSIRISHATRSQEPELA